MTSCEAVKNSKEQTDMTTGSEGQVSYTKTLVDFAVGTNFENLPSEVVHETKRIILDTIGCGIGGYSLNRGKIVVELARDLGGRPEASIFVTGCKVSCANAAFANADLANALDADETLLNFAHFANVLVANALAVGELQGATGQDLITAVAVGFDITARIGLSMVPFQILGEPPDEKLQFAPTYGMGFITPGGAVTAGKILGLDNEQMADALGLAGANATPPTLTKLSLGRFSMQKYVFYGLIAHIGVLAALLAQKGYTGDHAILDGDLGLWRFLGSAQVNWSVLVEELGKKWWILEDSIKPYPCCRFLNSSVDLFHRIIREENIQPEEIESVTVRLHPVAMGSHVLSEPYLTLDPTDASTPFNLQFSAPYVIAMAALGVKPGPDWYSPKRLTDPWVEELMKKVKVEANPEAFREVLRAVREEPTKRFKRCPSSITVIANGKAFEAHTEFSKGDPWVAETRMSDNELKEKFRNFCHNIIRYNKIEKAIELIYELEKLDNVAKLAEVLAA